MTDELCQDGPPDAPALLLIHGTAASARSWEPMIPLLAGSHHVLRINLPGASYAVGDQARRAAEALDRLGVRHAVLVGHSSGGAIATALAEQRPELVTGLVLVNTGPDLAAFVGQDTAVDPEQWPNLTEDQLRQVAGSGFAPGFEIPRAFLDQVRDMDLRVFAGTSQAILAYLAEQPLPERLAALGKPLLVIFGEEDMRWRSSSAAEYRAVPGARVELLPGVGHSPNLEDPARTAALVLAFTTWLGLW